MANFLKKLTKKSPKKATPAAAGGGINLADMADLSQDDRMAVMRMVAEGELSVDEAIKSVKTQAVAKVELKRGNGPNRRGGVKRAFRGRVRIEVMVIGPDKPISVMVVKVASCRDLEPVNANPFTTLQVLPDLKNPASPTINQTAIKKNSKHPTFDEQFQWEVRRKDIDLDHTRLHITVKDRKQGTIGHKDVFLGSMSFALAEVFEPENPGPNGAVSGWFKLLDEKKGYFQHQLFVPKLKPRVQAGGGAAPATARASQPLPPPPVATPAPTPSSSSRPPPAAASAPTRAARPAQPAAPAPVAAKPTAPPLNAADFTYTKVLGRGSFGKVMLAEMGGCDDVFAIKILKKTSVVEDDDVAGTMTEKRVLELSEGSPFLTKLHATFHTDAHLFFVMEFVNGGDLMYHIQNQRIFPPKQSQFYAAEIMLGLWYLHENGVVYRDLKLDNVMLEASGHIKIADFGMCKENMFGGARTTTFCGTPGYLAPEIIKEKPYGASVDFWSLGVLCYEFLVGDSPFEADEDDELFDQICNAPLEWPAKLDPSAKDFVNRLLDRNPTTRIGCGPTGKADIQRHAFFSGMDWGKMAKRQIPPPFKPDIKNPKKAECFDEEFTDEPSIITPIDKAFVAQIEQAEFDGFSFVNATGLLAHRGGADMGAAPVVNKRDLRQFPWYQPQLNRSDVVRLLKGKAAGAFCVRESASQPGCFALSVSVSPKADKLWTGLITPTDDGKGGERYRLFVKQKFDNIPDLIKFYHTSPCVTIDQGRREVCLVDVAGL